MRFLLFFFFLLPTLGHAVLEDQLAVKPNRDYMQFFLRGYLPWFKEKFHFELGNDPLVKEALKAIDHWRTPEFPELDQLLIGEGFNEKGQPFYTYRVYVSPELRKSSFAKTYPLPPHFLEWSSERGWCFLSPVQDFKTIKAPRYAGVTSFGHHCRDKKGQWALREVSFLGKDDDLASLNPFQGQSTFVWKTYDEEGVKLNQYFVKTTHLGLVPKAFRPYINAHGADILLPFDKYSIDRRGRMIIYYP